MTEFAYNNKQYLSTGDSLLINPGRYSKTNEVIKRSADKKMRGSC